MTIRIERLAAGEGDRWRRIRMSALAEAPYAFGTTHAQAEAWNAARWQAQLLAFPTFVAVGDGGDVGVARGAVHARDDVRELISMWVAPHARRRGIGARLVESVAAWAKAAGASMLVLDVVAANTPALALYERMGFQRFAGDALGELAANEVRLGRSLAGWNA